MIDRELDAKVATHVMKLEHVGIYQRAKFRILDHEAVNNGWYAPWMDTRLNRKLVSVEPEVTRLLCWYEAQVTEVPEFSSDIEMAWLVVEKMQENNLAIELFEEYLNGRETFIYCDAQKAAKAICLAALKAVEMVA